MSSFPRNPVGVGKLVAYSLFNSNLRLSCQNIYWFRLARDRERSSQSSMRRHGRSQRGVDSVEDLVSETLYCSRLGLIAVSRHECLCIVKAYALLLEILLPLQVG